MRHSIFRQIKPGWKRFMRGATGLLVVLLFWALLSRRHHPLILPSPGETFKAMRGLWQSGSLWVNIIITLSRTLLGYSLALLAGTILALLLKASPFWQDFFRPIITVIQIIPPVVWVVFAVIWFGIAADLTPVFLIFIVTFPIIFINIFSGLDSIDSRLVEMARVYRCSRRKIITGIYFPGLVPHLVSAISVGISFAWKSTIFAEYIGSNSGVGFALSMANSNLETEKLFAWTLILVLFMLVFEYGLLQALERRVTGWSTDEERE